MARITSGKVSTKPGDVSIGGSVGGGGVTNTDVLVFFNSVTATGGSQISSGSFASVATAYIGMKAFFSGIRVSGGGVPLIAIRTSSDGTNYAASDTAYSYAGGGNTATAVGMSDTCSTATSLIFLTASGGGGRLGVGAGENLCAEVTLMNLTATTAFPMFEISSVWEAENEMAGQFVCGRRTEAIPQAGLLLLSVNGHTFQSGRMDIYGIRAQ